MVCPDQARLALTEVEQTNTPSDNPSTPSGINMICKFITYTLLKLSKSFFYF